MKKVVKLKGTQIYDIANQILKEQSSEGIGPYPPKRDIAPDENPTLKNLPPSMRESSGNVTSAKARVKGGIIQAKRSMEELIKLTEVNPEIGGIVNMLEKTLSKFEEIFGLPKTSDPDIKK